MSLVIDLIGQQSRELLVVGQISRDITGFVDLNPLYQITTSPILSPYFSYKSAGEKLLRYQKIHLG